MPKITLDRSASESCKRSALEDILRELSSRVTISGDAITVNNRSDEEKVTYILNRYNVDYSRSSY